mgnify:CR=1 FL=1
MDVDGEMSGPFKPGEKLIVIKQVVIVRIYCLLAGS